MQFKLHGGIDWSVGSCHDSRSASINERFEIPDGPDVETKGIEKARKIVKALHEKHSYLVDYALSARLQITKEVWETHFEDERPARPAIHAQQAQPAVPAHLEEKILL